MRCIIVDDEPLARNGIEKYVAQIGFLEYAGSFENPLLADQVLREGKADLMILDIQMPYLTGIDFLKSLKNPPLVIFHTAYPNFALEGYQLDVIDYLVKPIAFERFYKAVSKAQEYFKLQSSVRPDEPIQTKEYFFIKCENRYEKIVLDKILYVEAMQNYSIIQTIGQRYITLMSLKAVEELLPDEAFFRVHKSYVVAIDKIESFEGNMAKVGGKMIPLGKQQRDELFERLIGNKIHDKKSGTD